MKIKGLMIAMMFGGLIPLFASESSAVWGEPASVWGKERMAFRRHAMLSNPENHYRLDFIQWKANAARMASCYLMLVEPVKEGNFSRPIDFLSMKINGIALKDIEPQAEGMKTFRGDGISGCSMTLDFDGVHVVLEWFMADKSPLLHCRIRQAPDSPHPAKTVEIGIHAVPSKSRLVDGKLVYSGVYHREAVSPVRTYSMADAKQTLGKEDTFLILQDQRLQPGKDGGAGPCVILLDPDFSGKRMLSLRNSWITSLFLNPDLSSGDLCFALWQSKTPRTNEEVAKLVKEFRLQKLKPLSPSNPANR